MTPSVKRARADREPARHISRKRPRRGSPPLTALLSPRPGRTDPAPAVLTDPAWSRGSRRIARCAVWAVPAYAALHLWLALRPAPDPAADPVGWAGQVTGAGYGRLQVFAGLGTGLLGLVGLVALAALLASTRSRRVAAAGLLAGLAAATVQLPVLGVAAYAAPALGEQVLAGNLAAAPAYVQASAAAGTMPIGDWQVPVGAVLVTLAWLLLGLAVWRSRVFSRGDGLLLGLAAPLLGLAGGELPVLVPIGAMLLLAAGIGIAWSGRRLVPARPPALAGPAGAESSVCQS